MKFEEIERIYYSGPNGVLYSPYSNDMILIKNKRVKEYISLMTYKTSKKCVYDIETPNQKIKATMLTVSNEDVYLGEL